MQGWSGGFIFKMKNKLTALALAGILALGGCGKTEQSKEPEKPTPLRLNGTVKAIYVDVNEGKTYLGISVPPQFFAYEGKADSTRWRKDTAEVDLRLKGYHNFFVSRPMGNSEINYTTHPFPLGVGDKIIFSLEDGFTQSPYGFEVSGTGPHQSHNGRINWYQKTK